MREGLRAQAWCIVAALLLLVGGGGGGCAKNWHDSHHEFSDPYEHGNYLQAADAAASIAKEGAPTDKVLLDMEAGAILRTAGKLAESNAAFDDADKLVGDYNSWPDVKISEETVAALTTVRTVNYRGSLSDLIMMNVYRALNFMEVGNADGARTALIRAGFVQQDVAEKYAAELRKAQDDLDKKKTDPNGQYDANKTMESKDASGRTLQQRLSEDTYKNLQELKPYADYVNPICDYMTGIYFYGAGLDASDRERAAVAFKRAYSMTASNNFVAEDVVAADRVANGSTPTPTTYVLFETGLAPELDQVQIPLPLFILSNQAPTVVLYFPVIKPRADFAPYVSADAGGKTYQSLVVSDVDAVLMQEFKNQLPTVITRMVIGAATKAAIDAAAKQGLKNQNEIAQLGFDVASTIYQVQMNQADLRAWRSLPKQFQVARFETPADRTVRISVGDGSAPTTVTLADNPSARVNVIYVKSVKAGLPPVIRQFAVTPGNPPPLSPYITPATQPTTSPLNIAGAPQ